MFKITIEGNTMGELAANALALAAQFQTVAAGGEATAPKQTSSRGRRTTAPAETTATEISAPQTSASPSDEVETDAELQRELTTPVDPMPETGKTIVDGGTGQPVKPAAPVKQMTMDEVKANAGKLAAKDMSTLSELIKKHGGDKLSTIPKGNLGDFAADVLEALAALS